MPNRHPRLHKISNHQSACISLLDMFKIKAKDTCHSRSADQILVKWALGPSERLLHTDLIMRQFDRGIAFFTSILHKALTSSISTSMEVAGSSHDFVAPSLVYWIFSGAFCWYHRIYDRTQFRVWELEDNQINGPGSVPMVSILHLRTFRPYVHALTPTARTAATSNTLVFASRTSDVQHQSGLGWWQNDQFRGRERAKTALLF